MFSYSCCCEELRCKPQACHSKKIFLASNGIEADTLYLSKIKKDSAKIIENFNFLIFHTFLRHIRDGWGILKD